MIFRPVRFLAAAVLFAPLLAFGQKNGCVDCHRQLEGSLKAPVAAFETDIHREYGLSCRDCHGGNAGTDDIALAKDKSFKGKPAKAKIPLFCGGCHADPPIAYTGLPANTSRRITFGWAGATRAFVCLFVGPASAVA